ncbi:MAG: VOC family protein [Thermoplasmata archaeon]
MIALADVAVTVTDAKRTAEWWTEKLDFAVHTVGAPGGHAVVVAPPGDRFVLHRCEGFAPVERGNTGIAFLTDDLEGQVHRMEGAGVRFAEPLEKGGGMAKFEDPDGNVFWLIGAPTEFIQQELSRKAGAPERAGPRKSGTTRQRSRRRASERVSA